MRNYTIGLIYFLKKNGVIGSKSYILKTIEHNKNIKPLKDIIIDYIKKSDPKSKKIRILFYIFSNVSKII